MSGPQWGQRFFNLKFVTAVVPLDAAAINRYTWKNRISRKSRKSSNIAKINRYKITLC
jgi:hypothetical protein